MPDKAKTKEQLLRELAESRQRIAELEASQADLRQAGEDIIRLASFPTLNPNPVIEVDPSGEITFFNPASERALQDMGMDRADMKAFVPENLSAILRDRTEEDKPALTTDVVIKGRVFSENIYFAPRYHTARIYAVDITERRRMEEETGEQLIAVKDQKNRLSALINSIQDEVWFADENGRFTLANPSALREFRLDAPTDGTDVEELARSLQIYHADGSPRSVDEAPPLSALRGKIVRNQEEIIRTPMGGELRYREVSAAPVKDASNRIIGSVSVVRDITDRKRAEEALEKTRKQLEFILANSLDAVYQRNIQTDRYEYVSPAVQRLTGFSVQEMMGLSTNDMLGLVHPDDLAGVKAEKTNPGFGVNEETGAVEYRFRTRSGEYRWLSDRFSMVRDSGGSPLYRVGIVRDITERKKNVEELQRSRDELELRVEERTAEVLRALDAAGRERQRLYDLLEALPVMICLLTPDYHVAFANRSFREKFGEPEGRRCYDFCFGNREPCEFCETYQVLKTGMPHHWEVTSPDGDTVIDAYDFPFADIDGSPLILEMDMDITDRRRTEGALKAAAAYDRSLIEASVDPLVTINPQGMISDVNIATEQATGYSRDRLIGTDFSDYFTDPEKARAGYQQVFKEGIVRDYELVIRHKDGHTTPVLYNASVYRDDEGNVIGVFAAARDISEQRRLEEQLRQSHKMEAIGTLTGGIAHDFNNILAAILGFAEMSLDDVPEGTLLERNLRYILRSSFRARDLIKQMLTFSRKSEYEMKPMPLTPLVRETAKLLRASIPTTIKIDVETLSTTDVVEANPTAIQQILMNLCTNASYAMRDTGGGVENNPLRRPNRFGLGLHGAHARPVRTDHRERHGRRDGRPHSKEDIRALLYHQKPGRRHRDGPCRCLRDSKEPERGDHGGE